MQMMCVCGFEFHGEYSADFCPLCKRDFTRGHFVFVEGRPTTGGFPNYDYGIWSNQFRQVHDAIVRSEAMYPDWPRYTADDVFKAIQGEFNEFRIAYESGVYFGKSGMIRELIDLACVAIKGIRQLRRIACCGDVVGRSLASAKIDGGWYIKPSPSKNPGKVWIGSPTGEGGEFDREELEAVLTAGFLTENMAGSIERFFWENF